MRVHFRQLGVGVCCQIPVERTKTSPLWEEEWDGGIATTYLARTKLHVVARTVVVAGILSQKPSVHTCTGRSGRRRV